MEDQIDEVILEPSREFVESTNVWAFIQEYGIDDYESLIERTTTEFDDVEASGLEWFWDEVVDYLGIEFYEDYDEVRDNSEGQQFTEWYPGGEISIAHSVLDRYAALDEETRNKVACIWEGEPAPQVIGRRGDPGGRHSRRTHDHMSSIENPEALEEIEAAR